VEEARLPPSERSGGPPSRLSALRDASTNLGRPAATHVARTARGARPRSRAAARALRTGGNVEGGRPDSRIAGGIGLRRQFRSSLFLPPLQHPCPCASHAHTKPPLSIGPSLPSERRSRPVIKFSAHTVAVMHNTVLQHPRNMNGAHRTVLSHSLQTPGVDEGEPDSLPEGRNARRIQSLVSVFPCLFPAGRRSLIVKKGVIMSGKSR
jgi:hypothetical protein